MKQKVFVPEYCKSFVKKIQAQWRNRVCSSLFQFGNKNNNKSQIRLENSFQEILCLMLNNMIDVWINNGSG